MHISRFWMPAAFLTVTLVALIGTPALGAAGSHLDPHTYFSQEQINRATAYSHPRYWYAIGSTLLAIVTAGMIALGPLGRWIGAWATRVSSGRWPLTTIVLAAIVTVLPAVVTFPLSYIGGFLRERRFHLSTQSSMGFISDVLKSTVFSVVVLSVAAIGLFFIVRRLPRAWPAAASGFLAALTVLLVIVYPLVYEPLFNTFKPVDAATRDRIVALAERAGVKVDRVLVADASRRTTKLNAYVSGLGATKRVVLYDTLLVGTSPQQVDLVVAHELGHVVRGDVWRGTLLGIVGAIGLVIVLWAMLRNARVLRLTGASGPGDPRILPFVAFVVAVATLITLPLANAFSRSIETRADRFAVRLTRDPATAVQTEVNLALRNVADLEPSAIIRWLYFTHPSTMERIAIALDEGARIGAP